MIFRQLFDGISSTYTYLLADESSKEAVLIDTVFENHVRDFALIEELGLKLVAVLDTHIHADHVTGAWLLKEKSQCSIGAAEITEAKGLDLKLKDGDQVTFGSHSLTVYATPGHTNGCVTYVNETKTMAFTGDALLIRGCGRCDFQQGDPKQLFHSINSKVFSLPDDCMLYPGHDYQGRTVTTVLEEKVHNARLGGGASENDFVRYMNAMDLPHPKQINEALPANMKCGQPEDSHQYQAPDWAPIHMTFSGVPEVDVSWIVQNINGLTIVDVRETFELDQHPESKVESSLNIPLEQLKDRLTEIPTDKPVMCLCRSGRRSSIAVSILAKNGFDQVANIKGGILSWQLM